jgi:hypothetical protein
MDFVAISLEIWQGKMNILQVQIHFFIDKSRLLINEIHHFIVVKSPSFKM